MVASVPTPCAKSTAAVSDEKRSSKVADFLTFTLVSLFAQQASFYVYIAPINTQILFAHRMPWIILIQIAKTVCLTLSLITFKRFYL